MIFFDTETCGLHGPIVTVQWADGIDGKISVYDVWRAPIRETLQLFEYFTHEGVCGFNLAFDWFHTCQMYTTMLLCQDHSSEPNIIDYAYSEPRARLGPCLKPSKCLDLMLHARKGPYQSTMNRGDVKIRRVPTALAQALATELDKRIPLKDIYFARKANKTIRWQVVDLEDEFGEVIPEFKDLVLRFAPSSALKALAVDALGLSAVDTMADIGVPEVFHPIELGYAPFALAGYYVKSSKGLRLRVRPSMDDWKGTWPDKIEFHINHWRYDERARKYAFNDVVYTRDLFKFFGEPPVNDDDSILACMVGAVRWRGFALDLEGVKAKREKYLQDVANARERFNFGSPEVCKRYLLEAMGDTEKAALMVNDAYSTKRTVLETVARWTEAVVCPDCRGTGCGKCDGGLIAGSAKHPAALRAQEILDARRAGKKVDLMDKLLLAGRFHASFVVIGALSSRMAGSDGLNPQGIHHEDEIRELFLKPEPEHDLLMAGGDFDAFEISIVDADYQDPTLREELIGGKKIHALFGSLFFGTTYEAILGSKGLPGDQDKYARSKNGVFAIIYFGNEHTLMTRVGLSAEQAATGMSRLLSKYEVFAAKRMKYADMFCSMRQPKGIGTVVEWNDPHEYVETMLGFRRYFTLENRICKELFKLAEKPPAAWASLPIKVQRRERLQTACGALRSALFGAAFGLQGENMRAAGNHRIQGTGAQITKRLQCQLWTIQPDGVHDWRIAPFNVHDEVNAATHTEEARRAQRIVEDFVTEMKGVIPFIKMDWKTGLQSWADKNAGKPVETSSYEDSDFAAAELLDESPELPGVVQDA
jgi:DNA polymerase I-like protein with 3'-5' exonuclease and polymerase domains